MPNLCGRKSSGLIHLRVPHYVNELEKTERLVLSKMIVNRPKSTVGFIDENIGLYTTR